MMRRYTGAVLLATVLAGCVTQKEPEIVYQARAGEDIVVHHYYVDPEHKRTFEVFVMDVLEPAFREVSPTANARVRFWLDKDRAEDDTFHYALVLDPSKEAYNYDLESLLRLAYGERRGEEYWSQFEGYLTRDATVEYQQTQW